jgi:predicted ATPase
MIKSMHFQNFRVLRDATLPLGPFTLIVGPNGSGKSTAMQALRFASTPGANAFDQVATAGSGLVGESEPGVRVSIDWYWDGGETTTVSERLLKRFFGPAPQDNGPCPDFLIKALAGFKVYSLDANSIAKPVGIDSIPELREDGYGLANVLDDLSDQEPERWGDLNRELNRWLPEFDHITLERASGSTKIFQLRTALGHHKYSASDLSQGTLFAVALLTLAYLKNPPAIVCLEEPDHGIHPRLLQNIRDAMYRLAYPKNFGANREPVQVIATTHSPYLLDLYKEHPEEVVIAHKDELGGHFERLSEKPHIAEILEGAPLGDIWFSGVLGGVPANT